MMITSVEINDDRVKTIGNVMMEILSQYPPDEVEIEAKIGTLDVKINRMIQPETAQAIKASIALNPAWQVYEAP
jgi:hypothetical protein